MKRSRILLCLGLILACFLAVLLFWPRRAATTAGGPGPRNTPAAAGSRASGAVVRPASTTFRSASTAPFMMRQSPGATNGVAGTTPTGDPRLKYRLSNTELTAGQLSRNDWGILLANALIDSSRPLNFAIPASLQARGDPGSYIVQARGPIDNAFRARLRGAGASIVAYIPNNAYLVRSGADAARQLASQPGTQAVLPFEPYYKLDATLLALAVEQKPLPPESELVVVAFSDARDAVVNALNQSGARIVREQPSPFGPVLTVRDVAEFTTLAGWSGVEMVELGSRRIAANDLSRATVGVAATSIAVDNYLNLSGKNVFVAVNDSGVDASHPDLMGRVFGFPTTDLEGHGTHVAGTIAGDGSQWSTVSNVLGSVMPATTNQFRGMAPAANLFAQSLALSDFDLQQNAARTNALISNNSWNYGNSDYDIFAASYDAAVRDSLPTVTGSQPVLYVFSAGNNGFGNDGGLGGSSGTILSPATAKNVVTVGTTELPRNISNIVTVVHSTPSGNVTNTSQPWLGETDSGVQVAAFSSRGNVGVDVEGDFGRFKPDVVAPGTFVVSTTWQDPAHWDMIAYYNITNYSTDFFPEQIVDPGVLTFPYIAFLPDTVVRLDINVSSATNSSIHFPIYASSTDFPTTGDLIGYDSVSFPADGPLPAGAAMFYAVGNTSSVPQLFNLVTTIVTTNDVGDKFQVLSNLNYNCGPYYRYETGTSMSAANVSGMLALIADFFTNTLSRPMPSPALMKALLINGARSVNDLLYDLQVNNAIDYQGWGLVALTNSLPPALTNGLGNQATGAPMLIFDQSPTNSLATGDRETIVVKADAASADQPLRVTLVWTDPPGNPAAGIKLVNDLDLIVTNLDTKDVYYGNDIQSLADFNFPWDTNGAPNIDTVNNIENVYIQSSSSSNGFSVTVLGHRVNVNAVTANSNNVAQDYALVISCGNGMNPTGLKVLSTSPILQDNTPNSLFVTNQFADVPTAPGEGISGALLLNQHVGASSPLIGTNTIPLGPDTIWGQPGTNGVIVLGVTNQWHFYVMSNDFAFTNAAFATFLPPDLALPRMGVTNVDHPENDARVEADIDLYVARGPSAFGLTNLDPAVVSAATKSLTRGGTEVIAFSNAQPGEVFYIGVKSEDQQAAEYAFFGVFSEQPFSQTDSNGVETVRGINVPAVIPDGTPAHPGAARVIGIALQSVTMRRVVVTNTITHQDRGDLFGQLKHGQQTAVLNNHTLGSANLTQTFIYEDNGENDIAGSQPTDAPKPLTTFAGLQGQGLWLLTEVDNALGHTGRVERLFLRLDPQSPPGGGGTTLSIQPNSFGFLVVDVPPEATNMTICVANISATPLPVQLYVRKGDFPTLTNFDYTITINPPGDCLSISTTDLPPLGPGQYFIGVYNPNGIEQTVTVTIFFGLSLTGVPTVNFTSDTGLPILDDAVTYSSILVTNNQRIVRCEVAVSINHSRISDMALTLVSPTGKRVLLYENRGGRDAANLGGGGLVTNFFGTQISGGFLVDTNVLSPVPTSGTLLIDYDFFPVPDTLDVYYEGANIFSTPPTSGSGTFSIPYGPGNATDITIVLNQGNNTNMGTAWIYTPRVVSQVINYFVFSENTNFAMLPTKFADTSVDRGDRFVLGDFEPPVLAGDYIASNNVAGWLLDTNQIGAGTNQFGGFISNQVSVVNDPFTARQPGTQFLALGHGIISTNLTLLPANRYVLTYDYRGPGIVSWWRGEPGIVAVDSIGGNNGFWVNNIDYSNAVVTDGFIFDGSSYIRVPDSPSLNFTNQFTLETWYKDLNTVFSDFGLIAKRGSGTDPCNFGINLLTNGLGVYYNDPNYTDVGDDVPGVYEASRDTNLPPANVFHHLAATYRQIDPATIELQTYIDGQLVRTKLLPGNLTNTLSTNDVTIGTSSPLGEFMNGVMDEVSIYDRVLSSSEIRAIYDAGSAGKFDPSATGEPGSPSNLASTLAKAQVSLAGGALTDTLFGRNTNWLTRSLTFTAVTNSLSLEVTGLEPGMLLDNFVLTRMPNESFVLPESSLEDLVGDSSEGVWTLEMWDNRVGAPAPGQELVSWQLRFILETNTVPVTQLFDRIPVFKSDPTCGFAYFFVDVPDWVDFVTNRLLFATAPVTVWFNQTALPTGMPPDFPIIGPDTNGIFVLSSNSVPPLIKGKRYFLGVENPCINGTNVTFGIEVDFGAEFIRLTNMVPYNVTNTGVTNGPQYFVYTVTTNAARAQFEINFPTGNMSLVARQGLPPPSLTTFDYISTNAGFNDELIVVITNSTPVPLTPGDWFLTALNDSGGPVAYSIMASEWPVTGRPFSITNLFLATNGFCLTWEALNGVHYFVQGIPDLVGTNWYAASFTLTEALTNGWLTYCVPLPSPFSYFRISEDLSLLDVPQPQPSLLASYYTNGIRLNWFDSVTARYQIQWTPSLVDPIVWSSFTNIATSPSTGFFQFIDDGTQTGGTNAALFYRASQIIVP